MIEIPKNIIESIIHQAINELPDEACGLLTGEGTRIFRQFPLINMDHSPEHFSFDPAEQFAVLKSARSEGQRIMANYHSHPATPARPSAEDIRLAFDPSLIYIIVSLAETEPVVKAFRIKDGKAENIAISII